MNNAIGIVVSFAFVIGILAFTSILVKAGLVKGEGSRKLIHIGVANWWIIAMIFFDNPIYASIVPGVFVIVNYISYKKQLIKAMERDGSKRDMGTVYYAISLFILTLITFGSDFHPFIGAIGILVMGYGDGFAAIIGESYGKHSIGFKGSKKTLEGSLAMFIFSFIVISYLLFIYSDGATLLISFLLAVYATLAELFTPQGFDNLTVPLGTSALYCLLLFLI